jgi:hypothetical protein
MKLGIQRRNVGRGRQPAEPEPVSDPAARREVDELAHRLGSHLSPAPFRSSF